LSADGYNVRIGRVGAWQAWMVVGALAGVLYPVLSPTTVAPAVLYSAIGLTSVLVGVAGVRRHRPDNARAWYVFAAGQLTWVIGDVVYTVNGMVFHLEAYPSWADVFYLAAYPLLAAGLAMLARGRGERDVAGLLDAGIIATGVALAYWVLMIDPITQDTSVPALARFISAAYPTADVLLFAVVARMLTGPLRRTPSGWLLIAGAALTFASDIFYTMVAAVSEYTGGIVNAGFLFAYVCWAGAALHPSMRAQSAAAPARRHRRGRLVILAAATLLAPAVLVAEGLRHPSDVDWLAITVGAVVLIGLVVARMFGFVTELQAQSQQLGELALRDALTGLANRRCFEQRLADAMATGSPQVALFDLNDFKSVNDRYGHAAGDRLLAAVAERLAGKLRGADLVARMGGDEFAVLVPDATPAEGDAIVQRLASALREPMVAGEHEFLIGASIGVAGAENTGDPAEVLRRADIAMYAAKDNGEKHRRYAPELDASASERARLGAEIRTALDTGQFRLVYQPIVELPTSRVVSVEALIRWDHPDRGPVSPAEFVPVAEQNGLIVELGAWILRTACAQAAAWRTEHGAAAPQRVSVNVSARQLAEPGFANLVSNTLAWTGLAAHNLIVEVTETAVFGGGQSVQTVKDLHQLGVRIALDDFGTGHSSLGLLQTVPVDILKVDRSFVENITMAGRHAVIATALIQVANGLGLTAVAEGVETAEQAAELHRLGYQLAQGYHFGRPVPEPEFRVLTPAAVA
jgi:diguanylate cyclase (GGDEF)-like protein